MLIFNKKNFTHEIWPKIIIDKFFLTWSDFGGFLNVEARKIVKIAKFI